jgi:hypothetical protein
MYGHQKFKIISFFYIFREKKRNSDEQLRIFFFFLFGLGLIVYLWMISGGFAMSSSEKHGGVWTGVCFASIYEQEDEGLDHVTKKKKTKKWAFFC